VSDQRNWAPGPDRYRRLRERRAEGSTQGGALPPREFQTDADRWRFEDTGITWDSFDVETIGSSNVERSRHRFRAHLPELIWNTAALEGNNFTLPEVKTLLEGVTVGGKKLQDEQQIIALSEAYNRLDEMVRTGEFSLSKGVSDELHGLVARHEAIESGSFRGEGRVQGGGTVQLASGGVVLGTEHGEGGVLREHFARLVDYLSTLRDARRRALIYFASATRRQFYFDGNKRTARLMIAGELMSNSYDLVSVPYSRKLEFNNALDILFGRDDATELLRFLSTCTLPELRRRLVGGELRQGITADSLHGPFVHADGSDGTVEADGRLVPVKDRPFEAPVPALHAYLGECLQQCPAVAVAPLALVDDQILEVNAVAAGPRGVVQEPDSDRDDLAILVDYVREHRGRRSEEGLTQVVRGRLYRVRLLLVCREPADAVQDPVFVAETRSPQDGSTGKCLHPLDRIRKGPSRNGSLPAVCPRPRARNTSVRNSRVTLRMLPRTDEGTCPTHSKRSGS